MERCWSLSLDISRQVIYNIIDGVLTIFSLFWSFFLFALGRKRILDFYNRTSLTAYCTAFAYRPVDTRFRQAAVCGGAEELFHSSGVYLELPTDSSHLYQPQRSPTPTDSVSLSRIQSDGNLYCGTTSAGLFSRSNDSVMAESPKEPNPDSPEGVFQLQCNQTFVGMVTMQYQARTDMV